MVYFKRVEKCTIEIKASRDSERAEMNRSAVRQTIQVMVVRQRVRCGKIKKIATLRATAASDL